MTEAARLSEDWIERDMFDHLSLIASEQSCDIRLEDLRRFGLQVKATISALTAENAALVKENLRLEEERAKAVCDYIQSESNGSAFISD